MSNQHYSAVTTVKKLFLDSMRRLIQQRLESFLGNKWWEEGVLAVLADAQRANILRNQREYRDRKRIDLVEECHLERIITTSNYPKVFESIFPNRERTRTYLRLICDARNELSHPRSGEMDAGKAIFFVYPMRHILQEVELPEAQDVERAYRSLVGPMGQPSQRKAFKMTATQCSKDCPCFGTPTTLPRTCPECMHEFKGKGWEGIDAHYRSRHEIAGKPTFEVWWSRICGDHR